MKFIPPRLIYRSFAIVILLLCNIPFLHAQTGDVLRNAIIWHPVDTAKAVGFRKQFTYTGGDKTATLYIFADSRYMLWINGQYVMRGPCRFDPKRPEYDSLEVAKYLQPGLNTIAVLVYGNISTGESMQHAPGLAIELQAGALTVTTDAGWRCSNTTRFGAPTAMWDGIRENINAAKEDGDWLQPAYNDNAWPLAVMQDKELWGEMYARTTPLQVATEVPFYVEGKKMPFEVKGKTSIFLKLQKNIAGYCVFKFDADAGTQISVFGHHYIAKQGKQEYITADVYGSGMTNIFATDIDDEPDSVSIPVYITKGRVKFTDIKVVKFVAPLKLVGSFHSSDNMLNRFWNVITNMHEQVTQDTYTDGVSEGNEWVADVHNISQFTKVAFAGFNDDSTLNYTYTKHLEKALSDFAISQQPDGRIKAHHPSDRFDLHWFIEDFSCIWIGEIRNYYEMTQNKAFVERLWPAVKKQIDWFKDSISNEGLIHGREWGIFDNPYAYKRGEGATLNAWVYKGFIDAAFIASLCGEENTAMEYKAIAAKMKTAFNKEFWRAGDGTFAGMRDSAATTHAAVMCLYTGICDSSHTTSVQKWLFKRTQDSIIYPFLHIFWFKDLYDMNNDAADRQVLNIIHKKYGNQWNAYNKGYLTAEQCDGGRNFHNFGMAPGYFFSAYLLGVRTNGPVWSKHILIEPRLGTLTRAEGVVVTEYGPVTVAWNKTVKTNTRTLDFSFTIPPGITATVGIPVTGTNYTLVVDGTTLIDKGSITGEGITVTPRFVYINNLAAGASHTGKVF